MTRKRALPPEFDELRGLVEEMLGGPLYDPSILDPRRHERKRGGQAIAGRYRGISAEEGEALDAAFNAVLKERGPLSAAQLAHHTANWMIKTQRKRKPAEREMVTTARATTFLRHKSKSGVS